MVRSNGMLDSRPHEVLKHQNIHIWHAALKQPDDVVRRLEVTLADDELQRADRFQFEHLRRSYIVARGVLRAILARYMNCQAGDVEFDYTPTGKPKLKKQPGTEEIYFNLSHSGDVVLYAIVLQRRIGIDVEQIRPVAELTDIAARTFSQDENIQLNEVPASQRLTAFFNCWTRKEAFIKAVGDGLSFPLHQFDVSLVPGKPAALLRVFDSEQKAAAWSMHEISTTNGYVASLVVEGNDCSLTHYKWAATLPALVM